MHIAEQGSGPLVVLCHGFPESWYSWRHQLKTLSEAGYHLVAPSQRGYGQTDRPEATGTVPEKLPAWLSEQDIDFFTGEFERTGFRGGLNWYRNFDRNWELTAFLSGAKLHQFRGRQAPQKPVVKRVLPSKPPRQIPSLLTMTWMGVGRGDEGVPNVW